MPEQPPPRPRGELRALVIGVSEAATCGVRDHATLLSEALGGAGVSCSWRWLSRREPTLRAARGEFSSWTSALVEELAAEPIDAIIMHYSVFSFSFRGVPVFVPAVTRALRGSRRPVLSILHEFAYPFGVGGPRGRAWALSQRAVLPAVIGSSAAVIVNVPSRARWLTSRRWLPARPTAFAPVFSNLPVPARPGETGACEHQVLGLFGYAYEGAASALVLDAVRKLHERGQQVRLQLLGAPGRGSPAAEAWLAGARSRGIESSISFSGILSPQQLSDALAACDLLLHPEATGPSSRKGTLAASLASGRPVVAIDGPGRWPELLQAEVLLVVPPHAEALADGIASLLEDPPRGTALGARGREFASAKMGVQRTVEAVVGMLRDAIGIGAPARSPAGAGARR